MVLCPATEYERPLTGKTTDSLSRQKPISGEPAQIPPAGIDPNPTIPEI
jgi:hypothetical protein